MRRIIGLLLVAALPLLALALPARGAWTFTRLSNNSGFSGSPQVGASGSNNVYVVWSDDTYGSTEIFLKRSTDGGLNWSFERISNNSGSSYNPAFFALGGDVHVVWRDSSYGHDEIFYKRSTDNGATWSFQRLSNNSQRATLPDVAASGSNVHVVWRDDSYGGIAEIFYKRSTDFGATWTFSRLTNNAGLSQHPAVAVDGTNVHVVWYDDTYGGWEILYKRSTDNGVTWSFERLTSNTGDSEYPSIDVYGSNIHVVWEDRTFGGNEEIFYKRSTDNGGSWSFQRLTYNLGPSLNPAVSVVGSNVRVVWVDLTFGNNREIFYKGSTNNGSSWAFQRLSSNPGSSGWPAVAEGNNVHVVWEDDTFSNAEIFYKRGP